MCFVPITAHRCSTFVWSWPCVILGTEHELRSTICHE
jgi:hypothetical protein